MNGLELANKTVTGGTEPTRYVLHNEDEDWAFLDGTTPNDVDDSLNMTRAEHLTTRDQSLNALADLPLGHSAWRATAGGTWEVERLQPEKD